MNSPTSTYRVQLSADFTFADLQKIIPYLDALGISTIYASPIFTARKGSTHGYDVVNPLEINPEIGALEELREIRQELKERDMNWLQDIVPNHMAYHSDNPWLADIFERGENSERYHFFDVDWEYRHEEFRGKLMTPFLGDNPDKVITAKDLKLNYEDASGFGLKYFEHEYPASEQSYSLILSHALNFLEGHSAQVKAYENLKDIERSLEKPSESTEEWKRKKKELSDYASADEAVSRAILDALEKINASPKLLKEVLEQQHFSFVHWQTTEREINYRRFFTINDLICLRMESEDVFQEYHKFIKQLCDESLINGLRIDHIDGLFDPEDYLKKLHKLTGKDRYIIIEKILEWDERLRKEWPTQGTSGYAFLAVVNQLFTDPGGKELFTSNYQGISEEVHDYEELIYRKKEFILKERMGGELNNLCALMEQRNLLPENDTTGKARWKEALGGFLAGFPVYRIYPDEFPLSHRQNEIISEAYETAKHQLPTYLDELNHLLKIFKGESDQGVEDQKYFLQRCQQFTGPLAAKGVEDTTFYTYNRLISHNEVGDSPDVFGITSETFHRRMKHRQQNLPLSINGTATHDTKRGEDARMRINALSEIPNEWFSLFANWKKLNASAKKKKNIPDENEEYFIYQALIGGWQENPDEEFLGRTREFMQKVLREAKVHSNWSAPDEEYENAVFTFLEKILSNEKFRKSFDPFALRMSHYGMIYSLGQSVLKITAPGIPDLYQGTELLDLSYVDPDNRRPVDYQERERLLKEISKENFDPGQLLRHSEYATLKMYTHYKALQERRSNKLLFEKGDYIPLEVHGEFAEKIIGYARKYKKQWYLIIVPRQVLALCGKDEFPLSGIWGNTEIALPKEAPQDWRNIYTNEELSLESNLMAGEALKEFPVCILKSIG